MCMAHDPAAARTLQGVLGDAQERIGFRPAPAFTTFSSHFATLVTLPSLTSATSAALAGTAPIDSSMAMLGPIFLDHAETLGAGTTNANVTSQRAFADASLFGQPFANLGLDSFPTLGRRTPTGNPASPALFGIRVRYHLDLHVWAVAVAVSHGFTDDFDVSVVVPVLSTALDCAVTGRIVQATGPSGGAFHPVDGPSVGGTIPAVQSTGIGDVTVRAKYRLPVPRPLRASATLEGQFPTGDPFELHGNGAYWIAPGVNLSLPLWDKRAELDAQAALNFNVTHERQSQALYGVSGSVVLWPTRLAAIVEFLGTSQLDTAFAPNDTDVLVLTPSGIQADPLLGVGWTGRFDQFNFSFGLRAIIPPKLVLFANGVVPLNRDVGVRPAGVVPTVGVGMTF